MEKHMTFEALRNEVASQVRKLNEKMPIGKALSFDQIKMLDSDGRVITGFEIQEKFGQFYIMLRGR